jgi:hypothetical protein
MKMLVCCVVLIFSLSACGGSQEAYSAVHQVVSDPLILPLGGHYYLTKERNGDFYLVVLDDNNEVSQVKKLF